MSVQSPPPDPRDLRETFRAVHARALDREGIPMILGMEDLRGPIPPCSDEGEIRRGHALSGLAQACFDAVVPWARDDDEAGVIAALQMISATHFAPDAFAPTEATAARKDAS